MADYGGGISLSQPHTSDDDDSDHSPLSVPTLSCLTGGSSSKTKKLTSTGDFVKKQRGRPPGSKNKPKPPIVITKDNDSALKPVIIEISAGSDVVETVIQFARRRHVGITVLSGSGSVSNVTLRHPMSHTTSLSLNGPFSLVSLSGSFLCSNSTLTPSSSSSPSSKPGSCSFGICLAGAQGQVFGGIVGGKVIAASLVVVVAATFLNPVFHRLSTEGDDDASEAQGRTEEFTGFAKISGSAPNESTKPTNINAIADDAAAVTAATSGSPISVRVYSSGGGPGAAPINCQTASDPMPWGPNSRSSY